MAALAALSLIYFVLIVLMLVADAWYGFTKVSGEELIEIFRRENIQHSILLTLFTCSVTAILSLIVSVPTGYLLSRYRFPGKLLFEAFFDIPIVLPPLVVGLSLLLLFNQFPTGASSFEKLLNRVGIEVTFHVPAIILAQFTVACAFSVRMMRNTFDQINPRTEQVAMTLGCSRANAFFRIVVPEAGKGISTAGTLAWTRAMGEFGPILVFAGTIPGKTEVLSSTVYLEIATGSLEAAVIVSLLMVTVSVLVLVVVRIWDRGSRIGNYYD